MADLLVPGSQQLLIGAACSISAPGLNEVICPMSPEVSPAGELVCPGAQLPNSIPGEGRETWIRTALGDCHLKRKDLPGHGTCSAHTGKSQTGQEESVTEDGWNDPGVPAVGPAPPGAGCGLL